MRIAVSDVVLFEGELQDTRIEFVGDSTFLEEDLINFLERGLLDEELGQVIKQFCSLQLSLIRHLRSIRYEPEKLSKELGIRKGTAEAILYNPMVEFEFPAVSVFGYAKKLLQRSGIKKIRNKGRISKHLGVIFNFDGEAS